MNLAKLGAVTRAVSADRATRATNADDSARLGGQPPSAFLSSSGTASNSLNLDGKNGNAFTTTGASSLNGNHYGLGPLGDLLTLSVAVGATSHHALIVGGTDKVADTAVGATAPALSLANSYANLTTAAMPMLPAGTQTVKHRGWTSGACVGFQNRRLHAVVLDN